MPTTLQRDDIACTEAGRCDRVAPNGFVGEIGARTQEIASSIAAELRGGGSMNAIAARVVEALSRPEEGVCNEHR